jgi:hypothetical protein
MPWVTTQETFYAQQNTFDDTMGLNCFYSKMRTTGCETAMMAKQGTQQVLVGFDNANQNFSHCFMTAFQCFSRLLFNSTGSSFKIDRRTIITMS